MSAQCWKEIGTEGNRSCPELATYGHCRNCPVYSSAGRKLLNRPMPEEIVTEWTALAAQKALELGGDNVSLFILRIHDEWLALRTKIFIEAGPAARARKLPLRSTAVFTGLVNVHGALLPCVDLAKLLAISEGKLPPAEPHLLIVESPDGPIAFNCHEAVGIRQFEEKALRPAPATVERCMGSLATHIVDSECGLATLLDSDRFLQALDRAIRQEES